MGQVQFSAVYKCPDGTDFPVNWEDERDAEHAWRWDQMHSPLPLTPLSTELSDDISAGFRRSFDVMGFPTYMERQFVNGYSYNRSVPFGDDAQTRAAVSRRDQDLRLDRVLEIWENDYRPEVEALTRATKTWASPELSLTQLLDRFDQVHAARRRLGELHMLAMGLATVASNRFIDFCLAEFGPEGELISSELTQGFPNKALESGIALWELSREALARPKVAEALQRHGGESLSEALDSVDGGADFIELLTGFLAAFGNRSDSFLDLSYPSWAEQPRFALALVRRFLDTPETDSPAARHKEAVRTREARLHEVQGRFDGNEDKRLQFHSWMKCAQQRTVLLEDHNFYIDQAGWCAARFPCLELGRHLALQGTIARREDVFYLYEAEIREGASDPTLKLADLVADRRSSRDYWLRVTPPTYIGTGQAAPNPMLDRFFGPAQEAPREVGVVKGVAASKGVVRGTARIILDLNEVERLGPGEILITHATAPPWTPLFAVAGAVVTEAGGILSHCAVVAREYKLPAVVGAKGAIQRIRDGSLVTVDGTAGIVHIEDGA